MKIDEIRSVANQLRNNSANVVNYCKTIYDALTAAIDFFANDPDASKIRQELNEYASYYRSAIDGYNAKYGELAAKMTNYANQLERANQEAASRIASLKTQIQNMLEAFNRSFS